MSKICDDFEIHAMSKCELALAYNPDVCPKRATALLRSWIMRSPGLMDQLQATGFCDQQKMLTPRQVELIVEALGEP